MTCPMSAMAATLATATKPQRSRSDGTRVQRMRDLLREQGGMTAAVLASRCGIAKPSHVNALLQRDIAYGSVTYCAGIYSWNHNLNARAHAARLTAAAKLLRSYGYTVKSPQ